MTTTAGGPGKTGSTGADTGADTEADTEADAEADTGADTGADVEADTRTDAGADTDALPTGAPAARWWRSHEVTRRAARWLRREPALASIGSLLIAVIMTWPTMAHPVSRIPRDIYDPLQESWRVAWSGHALFTDPANLWNGNVFYPEPDTLAFSDSLLGYAPLTLLGSGPTATLLEYNLLYVFAFALAGLGGYVLARALGAAVPGALVAGAAFGYAPWRWEHGGHLNILSTGGMALSLGLLAYGHGWSLRRRTTPQITRPRWALVGWLVAAWQMTLGFGITIPFAYLLALLGVVTVVLWLARPDRRPDRRLVTADLAGLAAFGLTSAVMVVPYLGILDRYPTSQRSEAEIGYFSPPLLGFLVGPESSAIWGGHQEQWRSQLTWPPEQVLLPGLVLIVFAVIGVSVSAWSRWRRLGLLAATLLSVVYALGPHAPANGAWTYLFLVRHFPGWDAMRTPGRLVIWTTLGLGLLAAGAVTELYDTLRAAGSGGTVRAAGSGGTVRAAGLGGTSRTVAPPVALALALLPALLVTIEGTGAQDFPAVPRPPVALSTVAAPIMVLPTDQLSDGAAMYWSTDGFPRITNGGSSFEPPIVDELRQAAESFPDAPSVEALRQAGIRTVVLDTVRAVGTSWEGAADAPLDGLPVTKREVPGGVVFTLQ
jgi:hypothetical protein